MARESRPYLTCAAKNSARAGERMLRICRLPEEQAFFPHEPDHIIARKHGGQTTVNNLALACFDCNRFKGADIASIDPTSCELTPLFNPRTQEWTEHFTVVRGLITPRTAVGRVTESVLRLNLQTRVEVREILTKIGRYLAESK